MTDLSRIQPLIDAIKALDKQCMAFQAPLMLEEKHALLQEHAKVWNTIMHSMQTHKICQNCQHCVEWEGKVCCAARDMAPIPFEVVNRIGGCSKWYEKDYIPFD